MIRKIINIDNDKCNGCGLCVPNCHEGALQVIDGKVRLISDLMCDGLGNCLGHCPEGAITITEREAKPYDEKKVLAENIIPAGINTITAHLKHLQDHNETEYLQQAAEVLKEHGIDNPLEGASPEPPVQHAGCPGSRMMNLKKGGEKPAAAEVSLTPGQSQLANWPVQLHLTNPGAPYFKSADVLMAADCVAFSYPDFHNKLLKGKTLVIACPKLDSNQEIYVEKLVSLIDNSEINTLTIARMEVPCCGGLISMAQEALSRSKRKIPIKEIVIGIQGTVLAQNWI